MLGGDNPEDICVDHHHGTGAVRGLLCTTHNRWVGVLEDPTFDYQAVSDYIARHNRPHG
jgi:hypothetical protein